jgi:hypothetical protein
MIVRGALALSAVLAAGFGLTPSHAATTSCRLISDGANDSSIAPGGPTSPAVDILSADIASGQRNLIGVLRLASLAADPQTAGGATYSLSWVVSGVPQKFALVVYPDGTSVASFHKDNGPGADSVIDVAATIDRATNSIIWTLGRKSHPQLRAATKTKPVKFTTLAATAQPATNLNVGINFSGSYNGDTASTGKSYTDRTVSCVKGT